MLAVACSAVTLGGCGTYTATPSATPSSPAPTATPTLTPRPKVSPTSHPSAQAPYAAAKAAGATAVCDDESWSYSKDRRGTCSHHGGVRWWTGNLGPAGPGGH